MSNRAVRPWRLLSTTRRRRCSELNGRTFLVFGRFPADAIISEPSNPWMTIAAKLLTRAFFEAGRSGMPPGDMFSQWI